MYSVVSNIKTVKCFKWHFKSNQTGFGNEPTMLNFL